LILPLEGQSSGRLRIAIHGQIFRPPRTLRVQVESESRVLHEQQVCVTTETVAIEAFPIEISGADSAKKLRIVLLIENCPSPAEIGLSDDIRKLGFGLQRIEISVAPDNPPAGVP